jgi:hypothetical protein
MFKKISGISIPLFFVFPFIGFITSLFNIKSKTSLLVYLLFAMLFGYSISFSDSSADSFRYAEAFKNFDNTLDYNQIVKLYQDGELRDLYRLMLFYFSSIFTDNPKVMFAIAGLIYGLISYACLMIFVKEHDGFIDIYVFSLSLIFFTYISLSNINGFRFWTGGLILFLASYNFIIEKKYFWFVIILTTPLFHYGFILIVPVFIFYRLIQSILVKNSKARKILFYIFILSFGLSWILGTNSINIGFLSQSDAFSGAVGNRLEYMNSSEVGEMVENRKENSIFLRVKGVFQSFINVYVFITLIYLFKRINKLDFVNNQILKLISFSLFFYSFSFIALSMPSGVRFLNIAHLFFVILIVKVYMIEENTVFFKRLILLAIPIFSFQIVFTNFMLPFMILSPTFWYGNFFWLIIEGIDFVI